MTTINYQAKSNSLFFAPPNSLVPPNKILDDIFTAKPVFDEYIISEKNKPVMQAIEDLRAKPPLTANISMLLGDVPVEEQLFDARANVKIMTSAVSMHIKEGLREKLFHQIDILHDPEEWESDETPINAASFKTFLSGFLQINPERGPGLGLSHTGNLIASWSTDRDRLVIEFMANNVKWVITRFIDYEPEQFTGYTKITRLFESLTPFDPEHWFSKKEESNGHT